MLVMSGQVVDVVRGLFKTYTVEPVGKLLGVGLPLRLVSRLAAAYTLVLPKVSPLRVTPAFWSNSTRLFWKVTSLATRLPPVPLSSIYKATLPCTVRPDWIVSVAPL